MATKVMKYKIEGSPLLYKLLKDAQYASWKVKNRATTLFHDWTSNSLTYKDINGDWPKDKVILGKTILSDIQGKAKESVAPMVSAALLNTSAKTAVDYYNTYKSDILRGNMSVPSYKREGSFPMRATNVFGLTESDNAKKYDVKLSLLSRKGASYYGVKAQIPAKLLAKGQASDILDRIIDGTYKLCDSNISRKNNDFYFNLTYKPLVTATYEATPHMDESKVVGVDLGIVYAAYAATNFDEYAKLPIGGGEIQSFRDRVEGRRKSMLNQSKYCGEGRKGHGRKTLMKPTEVLRHKVENFRQTTNHKYSKAIVEFAVSNGCGTIQMEDLSGINSKSKFLRNWSYFELQTYLTYKAKEVGIKVVKISPKYTSQRCSCCGYINEGNRPKDDGQDKFECLACEYKTNADFNAARNIAEPRIETLIKDELKRQENEKKRTALAG